MIQVHFILRHTAVGSHVLVVDGTRTKEHLANLARLEVGDRIIETLPRTGLTVILLDELVRGAHDDSARRMRFGEEHSLLTS